jgi:pimeloyl-ACP methyl ester carboxylesterase
LLRNNDADSFLAAYKCFVNSDKELVGSLSALKCPVLVMTGKHDSGSTPAMAENLASTIPEAECSVLFRGWHMIPVERAADVNFLLREFIEGASS